MARWVLSVSLVRSGCVVAAAYVQRVLSYWFLLRSILILCGAMMSGTEVSVFLTCLTNLNTNVVAAASDGVVKGGRGSQDGLGDGLCKA